MSREWQEEVREGFLEEVTLRAALKKKRSLVGTPGKQRPDKKHRFRKAQKYVRT